MICEIICIDGFLCMSHLDIVHMLSAYVHVIHILSGHMRIMCTLSAVVLDMFLSSTQCRCHPYVISSTLYISYHVQLSICTLSAQMHIVHIICMLSTHVHIICFSSLPLLIYLIIHNLVSAHCLHMHIVDVICMLSAHVHVICLSSLTLLMYPIIYNLVSVHIVSTHAHCRYHLYIVYRCICYVHLINVIHMSHCLHRRTLSISSACCVHMYTSFACHF